MAKKLKFKREPKDLVGDIIVFDEMLEKPGAASIQILFRIQHTDWKTKQFHRKPRGVLTIGKYCFLISIHAAVVCY